MGPKLMHLTSPGERTGGHFPTPNAVLILERDAHSRTNVFVCRDASAGLRGLGLFRAYKLKVLSRCDGGVTFGSIRVVPGTTGKHMLDKRSSNFRFVKYDKLLGVRGYD